MQQRESEELYDGFEANNFYFIDIKIVFNTMKYVFWVSIKINYIKKIVLIGVDIHGQKFYKL